MLPPGKHTLTASYIDGENNQEIKQMPVEVPEMSLR